MLVSLCRTFYLYEQWEDFDRVCSHINEITNSGDGGLLGGLGTRESNRVGQWR